MSFSPEPDDDEPTNGVIKNGESKRESFLDSLIAQQSEFPLKPIDNSDTNNAGDRQNNNKIRDPRLAPRDKHVKHVKHNEGTDNRNGIDTKVWSDIFNVEKVTDIGTLPIDMNGLSDFRSQLRQPMRIGEYSLVIDPKTKDRDFFHDESELKYIHAPPKNASLSFDLNHGYVRDINWGETTDVKLDELLQWIKINRKKFMVANEVKPGDLHTDFVTYRGIFTKIMTAPYENMQKWLICATKFRGTLYMCEFQLECNKNPSPDDFFNRLSFGGYRFEQYLCSPFEDIPPDPNIFNLNTNQYCCVVRSRIFDNVKSHSYVFGAEVDCAIPQFKGPPGTLGNFVEIKTTKKIDREYEYRNFLKYKLLKWWAQSYLVGVPKIYCGYRNDRLVINETELLEIDKFPEFASNYWSPNVCLNFLNQFLSFVKECVTIDDPNVVYQFYFEIDPNSRDRKTITCKRVSDPGKYQILPEWYINEFAL